MNLDFSNDNTPTRMDVILALARHQMRMLPLDGKVPQLKDFPNNSSSDFDTLRSWFLNTAANVGIATGPTSGIIVVDVDAKSGGLENLTKAQEEFGALPRGPRVHTPGGGDHYYFLYPHGNGIVPNAVALAGYSGIDVRADRAQVVAPPSVGPNGIAYRFADGLSLDDIALPVLPDRWLQVILNKRKTPSPARSDASGTIAEGTRNATLFGRACSLRGAGCDEDAILEELQRLNQSCSPPLEWDEVEALAESAMRYEPNLPFTDVGNARRLIQQHGPDIRFCIDRGAWFVWNNKTWSKDNG